MTIDYQIADKGLATNIQSTRSRVRLAVSAFYFFQGLCFASWASRIPDIKSALMLSDGAMGSILFALPAGQMLTMPFSGFLASKYGSKKIMRFAPPMYAIAMVSLSLATSSLQLAMALFFFGITGNISNIAINTQAVVAEKMYRRPIMASFHGSWSLAGFAGALIGLLMGILQLSPTHHFLMVCAVAIGSTLLNSNYLLDDVSSSPERKKFFTKPDGLLFSLGVVGFFAMSCEGAMFDWSGVYFKDIVGATGGWVTLGYASFMVMMTAGRFIGNKFISAFGQKRLMQINGALIAIGLLISVLLPTIPTAVFGFLLVGFGVSTNIPIVFSLAGAHKTMAPSKALAAVSSISYLGFLLGPPMIGYISEVFNLRISYLLIAVFGLMISLMVTRLKAMK
ncbi:MFS transporter [Jiulongibacter sediminis]|uniref:Major facilitator transporter n=1 Tax=Jiulongibacter sediminis TaxID=1605367 RepID=A0A0P7CB27_9BACT|nr:MFS transporter [Jiulongibacter sediminis]KPM49958.1 major facilitator transporter [Jiulongibacter sediminis]TBX26991.1 major facilitator transporter [Jiulongibacter sediminis]